MSGPAVVLHLRVVTGTGGGPEKTILRSARYIDPARYRLIIAYMRNHHDPTYDVRQHAEHLGLNFVDLEERYAFDPGMIGRIVRLVRERSVNILHAHDYKSDVLGLFVAQRTGCRLITTVHGWITGTRKERLYVAIDRWALRRYERVIAVSRNMAEQLKALRVPESRLRVVHNAIEVDQFPFVARSNALKTELGLSDKTQLLGAVGRLSPEKALDRLVRAVGQVKQAMPDLHVVLVGEGSEREPLKKLCAEVGVTDRFHFLGHRAPMQPIYESLDALCLPSLTEGLPNVVLEAQAMGVPVIGTDVGGVGELIQNQSTGWLIPPDDVPAIARAMRELFTDAERSAKFARAARQQIENQFTFEARMRKVVAIYDELIAPEK